MQRGSLSFVIAAGVTAEVTVRVAKEQSGEPSSTASSPFSTTLAVLRIGSAQRALRAGHWALGQSSGWALTGRATQLAARHCASLAMTDAQS